MISALSFLLPLKINGASDIGEAQLTSSCALNTSQRYDYPDIEKGSEMKIVVLDGYTTNPGDLTWQGLEEAAHCEIYDRCAVGDIVTRAADAEILLRNL